MTTAKKAREDQRTQMIADAAYFRAERRGFNDGDPVTDWLEAEADVDARLREMRGKRLLEELDERLAVANGRLRELKKRLSGVKNDVQEEWTHDVEKLAKLRDKFQERLEEIRAQGEHASDKAKAQADKIWHEISDVVERVSSRKSGGAR
jgi:DNA anti-recombination protein RmuC